MYCLVKCRVVIMAVLVAALFTTVSAFAQTRTTPVTISSPGNTVQAQQSGTWDVGVVGTPNVSVTNSPNVSVINTPSVNVANTPNVSVANSPTVKIDSTSNTVKAPTQSNTVQLWSENQTVAPLSFLYGPTITCSGYKELRVVIRTSTSNPSGLSVYYRCRIGMAWVALGSATWNTPAHSITDAANFVPVSNTCMFTVPVMSDQCDIYLYNGSSTNTYTISSYSWVYLVN
ncbi:MAG: hypothetical protein ACYC64_08085 [Armatimonadota bacterium]